MKARLPAGLAEQTLFGEPAEMRRIALQMFDRSFAITYALEAIAVVIGLAGVAATFSARTLARTREFGMLRHIGVTRRQVGLMLASEGALLGLVGGIAGIALGLAMAQVLIHVVNPQSFHWTMDTAMPWPLLLGLVPALMLAAAGAAVLAGRRALVGRCRARCPGRIGDALWLLALASLLLVAAGPDYAVVKPGVALNFPRDHGAHPEFRTEWWYATGWLLTETGEKLGFQVTFFRIKPPVDRANPSAFAAKQVIFAHAALSDVKGKKLFHDQRIARAGFGLAGAKIGDTDVSVDGWRMVRGGDGAFKTRHRRG